jgi:hypothetical protein
MVRGRRFSTVLFQIMSEAIAWRPKIGSGRRTGGIRCRDGNNQDISSSSSILQTFQAETRTTAAIKLTQWPDRLSGSRLLPVAKLRGGIVRRVLISLALVLVLVVPANAAGAVNEYICNAVPSSVFSDVPQNSPYKVFIDCMVYYGVASGTSPTTYSPAQTVERWQMALFLQNLWGALAIVPLSGSDQGFTDIGSLTSDAQVAVNQTAQLSVTSGVGPNLIGPFDPVPRWQMAIFLARFARATGLTLPAPTTSGFADIAGLSTEARNSISIVKTLGITTGTSATTFSPNNPVTRDQMAAFLIRTLQATWFIATTDFVDSCSENAEGVEICRGAGDYVESVPLRLVHGWFVELPGDTSGLDHPGTTVQLYIDGTLKPSTEVPVILSGAKYRNWEVLISGGLSGNHLVEARYYSEGVLTAVESATITFS